MYSSTSHLYEETLPPCFVIGLFQINKDGDRDFVHLESILNLLCASNQLVFCDLVTSEASLAWGDDTVVFEPPIQTSLIILSTSVPIHDVSDGQSWMVHYSLCSSSAIVQRHSIPIVQIVLKAPPLAHM